MTVTIAYHMATYMEIQEVMLFSSLSKEWSTFLRTDREQWLQFCRENLAAIGGPGSTGGRIPPGAGPVFHGVPGSTGAQARVPRGGDFHGGPGPRRLCHAVQCRAVLCLVDYILIPHDQDQEEEAKHGKRRKQGHDQCSSARVLFSSPRVSFNFAMVLFSLPMLFALLFLAFFNPDSRHRPPTLHRGSEDSL